MRLTEGAIIHGTKAIITVTQGFVGLAMDRGQPILLPPGLHQWDSPTIEHLDVKAERPGRRGFNSSSTWLPASSASGHTP